MKKTLIAVFVLLAAVIIAAGCITTNEDTKDPLIGTWVSGEYTNSAGMHYLKIYETFYPDNTGAEKGYIDDGSLSQWNHMWVKLSENKYEAYYNPITFYLSADKQSAKAESTDTDVNNWIFKKTSGPEGIVGTWETETEYPFEGYSYLVSGETYEDGSGFLAFENEVGKMSYNFSWTEIGTNMYVIALSQKISLEIKSDGRLYDNYGCVYTKV